MLLRVSAALHHCILESGLTPAAWLYRKHSLPRSRHVPLRCARARAGRHGAFSTSSCACVRLAVSYANACARARVSISVLAGQSGEQCGSHGTRRDRRLYARTPSILWAFSVPSCLEKEQSRAQHCLSYTLKYGSTVAQSAATWHEAGLCVGDLGKGRCQ